MEEIDPKRLYGFPEAAALIPGSRKLGICLATLHAWRKQGRFQAEERKGPKGQVRYFVWGYVLLQLAPAPPPDASHVRSPAQRKREIAEAEKYLRKIGMILEPEEEERRARIRRSRIEKRRQQTQQRGTP